MVHVELAPHVIGPYLHVDGNVELHVGFDASEPDVADLPAHFQVESDVLDAQLVGGELEFRAGGKGRRQLDRHVELLARQRVGHDAGVDYVDVEAAALGVELHLEGALEVGDGVGCETHRGLLAVGRPQRHDVRAADFDIVMALARQVERGDAFEAIAFRRTTCAAGGAPEYQLIGRHAEQLRDGGQVADVGRACARFPFRDCLT